MKRQGEESPLHFVNGIVIAPTRTNVTRGVETMGSDASKDRAGLGDDQGTRVGRPTPPGEGSTGMGSEASEGIHGADADRDESDATSLEGKSTGRDGERAGSEPLKDREQEHHSRYGGAGGEPKNGY